MALVACRRDNASNNPFNINIGLRARVATSAHGSRVVKLRPHFKKSHANTMAFRRGLDDVRPLLYVICRNIPHCGKILAVPSSGLYKARR